MNNTNLTERLIIEQLAEMRGDMKDGFKELSYAVNKLVALETSQAAMNQLIDRQIKNQEKSDEKIDILEQRIDKLEQDAPMNRQVVTWVMAAMWAAVAAAATAVVSFLGFI